jgi:hypothetical protein
MASVREPTIPTERPPPVSEGSANCYLLLLLLLLRGGSDSMSSSVCCYYCYFFLLLLERGETLTSRHLEGMQEGRTHNME